MRKNNKHYLIIFVLFFLILFFFPKSFANESKKFLSLKNNEVNLRQGPSFEYPVRFIYKKTIHERRWAFCSDVANDFMFNTNPPKHQMSMNLVKDSFERELDAPVDNIEPESTGAAKEVVNYY